MLKRVKIVAIAIAAIGFAGSAQAADCEGKYQAFWEKISGNPKDIQGVNISTIAAVNRVALRAFDACQSADDGKFGADFWDQIKGDIKDPKKFWEDLSLYGEAK